MTLLAFGLQVIIAILEIRTGFHLTDYGALYLERWGVANVEVLFGPVAWGTEYSRTAP